MLTERDQKIINLLETNKYMSRWAIQQWLFTGFKNNKDAADKCNRRLNRLIAQGIITKVRWYENNNCFVYYMGKRHDNWRQYAWVNELAAKINNHIYSYQHEVVVGSVRADGLIILQNGIKLFVEVDSSNNEFDKPTKYNTLFNDYNSWTREWWATYKRLEPSFPRIVVVTHRPKRVEKLIKGSPLKWFVFTPDDVERIKEVIT